MEINDVLTAEGGFKICWSEEGVGFGELTLRKVDDKFVLDSECMGDDFCKKVFSAFVDKYLPEDFKNNNLKTIIVEKNEKEELIDFNDVKYFENRRDASVDDLVRAIKDDSSLEIIQKRFDIVIRTQKQLRLLEDALIVYRITKNK